VVVDKTTGIERDGWMLTGGITFYESPVWIQYSSIGHNFGEDALNLVRSRFTLNQVEFLYTYSDAFDGDFVDGLVKNCSFHNITGDGLDLNGSEVRVNNSTFTQIEDKAISAGENSHITINNSKFTDINIGVASKDLSRVSLGSSTIDTAREVALAVYIKKQQYGPASITASDVEILNTDKVGLCQMGSSLLIDDKPWGCEQLDIQKLYDDGVLGN
jgi:hypothetical protein